MITHNTNCIPPGLVDDNMEIFVYNDQAFVIYKGSRINFWDLPMEIIQNFLEEMENNHQAVKALQKLGIKSVVKQLEQYVKCNYGACDSAPDFDSGSGETNTEWWDCGNRGSCIVEGELCRKIKVGDLYITKREIDIIRLISDGLVLKQVADKLFISEHTVNTHRKNILYKIGGHSITDITNFAYQHNIKSRDNGIR